jgi:hypothetical protein
MAERTRIIRETLEAGHRLNIDQERFLFAEVDWLKALLSEIVELDQKHLQDCEEMCWACRPGFRHAVFNTCQTVIAKIGPST